MACWQVEFMSFQTLAVLTRLLLQDVLQVHHLSTVT